MRRKNRDYVRKLVGVGKYSYSVTIPKGIVYELGWRKRQKLVVRREGSKVVVEDWKS